MNLFNAHESKKGHRNIKCNVYSCVHHHENNHCTAGKINVGPSDATQTADTVCATFEQK